jgi:DNA-binding CsgD family transcriptional regulator
VDVFNQHDRQRVIDKLGIDPEESYREWMSRLTGRRGEALEQFIAHGLRETMEDFVAEVPDVELLPAERTVLTLVARGLGQIEIAETLGRSTETVKTQVRQARRRLGARTTAHAVALAIVSGALLDDHERAA